MYSWKGYMAACESIRAILATRTTSQSSAYDPTQPKSNRIQTKLEIVGLHIWREKGDKYAAASHLITRVFYRPLGHTSPVRPSGVSRPGASGIWRGQSAGFGGGGGIGSPPIFMGAKVKLVAYGVHLLIKYLLTKGNT